MAAGNENPDNAPGPEDQDPVGAQPAGNQDQPAEGSGAWQNHAGQ